MATARRSSSRNSRRSRGKTSSHRGTSRATSAKKASSRSRRKYGPKTKRRMSKVMREYKHGQLKSGGRRKVKNRKQAVAIGLSEARRSGAKVPPRKKAA
jgi:hypothetical protein